MNINYFGTDGIRDKVGSGMLQPEKILKLGWAAGMALNSVDKNNEVLIGKDTRISGYMLESALESGLSSAGMNVGLLGPMPTPAIAYLTKTFRCTAGIVISASHNPYYDNGVKFFGPDGYKISQDLEERISYYMDKPLIVTESHKIGKARRIDGAPDRYIEFCKSKINNGVSLYGLKIVIDSANGSTYHIASKVFQELGAKVSLIGNQPDGFNINYECGSTNVSKLQKEVIKTNADIGIAYDGDGDRTILVDNKGNIVDGDCILYILANYFYDNKMLDNTGIIGTIMSNQGLEDALKTKNIPMLRTDVGDKYVMKKLLEEKWFLGGEPSGHLLNLKNSTTGDGIISSIMVINAMIEKNKSLFELLNNFEKYPQKLYSIECQNPKKVIINNNMQDIIENANDYIKGRGRILIRASGTEPKIRLMVESNNKNIVESFSEELKAKLMKTIRELKDV
jgi:phosphoglucosamine mutase